MPDVEDHGPAHAGGPLSASIEEIVAANVRRLRTARELTQGELAEKTDGRVNEQRVWALENGRRRFTVVDLASLADALDIDPAVLMSADSAALPPAPPPPPTLPPAPPLHEVTLDTNVIESVQAHTAELSDGWLHFFRDNERVFFAPASRVLHVRVVGQPNGNGQEADDA